MNKGFTFLEILIVISILGVLASLALFTYPVSQQRARDSQRLSDLNQYKTALANYSNYNGGLFPIHPTTTRLDNLCSELNVPDCPVDPKEGVYRYQSDASGTRFIIWSELEAQEYSWAECSDGNSGVLVGNPSSGNCNIEVPEQPVPTNTPTPNPNPPTPTPTPINLIPSATPTPTPTPQVLTNLVSNPSFESDEDNWGWNSDPSNAANFSVVNGGTVGSKMARIRKITNTNITDIQLLQYPLVLEPNKNYRVTLDAKANVDSNFRILIHKHSGGGNYGLNYQIDVGTTWQTYTTDFVSTPSASSDARLRMRFNGSPVSEINIDNISLVAL